LGRKRHTPEKIIHKLRQAEVELGKGATVPQAAKKIGLTEQTLYRLRTECGGMWVEQAKRLEVLKGVTPGDVHLGRREEILTRRKRLAIRTTAARREHYRRPMLEAGTTGTGTPEVLLS